MSMIKKIDLEKITTGMKVAEDIHTKYGGILIPEGTILTEYFVGRLKNLDVDEIKIVIKGENRVKENPVNDTNQMRLKYEKNVEKSFSIFKKAKYQEELMFEDVEELTDNAIKLAEDLDIFDSLTMVRSVDRYTYSHLLNVGILANLFGNWLKLEEENIKELTKAGLLHDIGKVKIPDEILKKPTNLTKDEFAIMKKHSKYGYDILQETSFISPLISSAVLTHHERIDGSGYPFAFKKEKIPFFGRILAIVDTFDALTADRVYQPASVPFKALRILKNINTFDYELKQLFIENISYCFVNEKVKLNNGKIAKVVFINPLYPDVPVIKCEENYIDMRNSHGLKIVEIISKND